MFAHIQRVVPFPVHVVAPSSRGTIGQVSDPLSAQQVGEFVERGFTIVHGAFGTDVAAAVRRELGRRIGIDLDDPGQWGQPRVWLQEVFSEPPFTDALTDRFVAAVDQIVGVRRWRLDRYLGWWLVTFPGFDDPPYGGDWHVEGDFVHHVWSPEQAILPLFCFSDVEPGGGGTLLAAGSHRVAARLLWESEPTGLASDDIWPEMNRRLDAMGWEIVEVTAQAGDVVLAHPLVFHSSNPNHGTRPRVMAQPRYDMIEPKRTAGRDLWPVEVPLARSRPAGN
jgi:hypothetical protein